MGDVKLLLSKAGYCSERALNKNPNEQKWLSQVGTFVKTTNKFYQKFEFEPPTPAVVGRARYHYATQPLRWRTFQQNARNCRISMLFMERRLF